MDKIGWLTGIHQHNCMFNNKMSALKYMLFALVLWTVLLHCVSGTSSKSKRKACMQCWQLNPYFHNSVDPNDCASQEELDAVERKVDELYSQLHYWQNVTINILKEQYFPSNPGTLNMSQACTVAHSASYHRSSQ